MIIYFIRHGETEANQRKCYLGSTDISLSEEGISKLEKKVNEGYYPKYEGQVVFTSSLKRTSQTLNVIYGDVDYIEEKRFNESNFGDFENKNYEELKNNPEYIKWITGDNMANRCPNGESFLDMKKRVLEAFTDIMDEYKDSGKDIIFVLHGGPIIALMEYLHPDEHRNFYEWSLDNGCLYTFNYI